jgi:hypothetical protein
MGMHAFLAGFTGQIHFAGFALALASLMGWVSLSPVALVAAVTVGLLAAGCWRCPHPAPVAQWRWLAGRCR